MSFAFNLDGRVAFVTGSSGGLGLRFAKVLASSGAKVVLAARRTDMLQQVQEEIRAEGGHAFIVKLDVTDHASIKAAVEDAENQAGAIDILVNNSGVAHPGAMQDVTPEEYGFVMDTNLRGAFFVAQEVGKRMIERGKLNPDLPQRIINIASVAGVKVLPHFGVYSLSKAGVIHMTKSMAVEWGIYGINVNAICPGVIETSINSEHLSSEQGQQLVATLPRKRVGHPEDLDGLLLLLASDKSGFINGGIYSADDGYLAQ